MELDFVTANLLEEEPVEIEENNHDLSNIEGERCGICMDIIIDRGLLDCCQHWFCFACIDNWSTITNLCPLCQSEFQLITCIPIYDIIGSHKVDEETFSRDDEWFVDGKGNTLSFPSYYIDENAVICLDGDGCKIRTEPTNFEGDSNLDTSIACDSCDIWYHAFCVGFDAEGTSEDTWICPRCIANEMSQKSDITPIERMSNQCAPEGANNECTEAAFSGKVSISVADAGETALVVSMVSGNQWTLEPSKNSILTSQIHENSDSDISYVVAPSNERNCSQLILEGKGLELSLSCDTSSDLVPLSLSFDGLKSNSVDEAMNESSSFDGARTSSSLSKFHSGGKISESESRMGLHLGLSVGSFLSVTGDVKQQNPAEGSSSKASADRTAPDMNADAVRNISIKRKHTDCSDVYIAADADDTKANNENEALPKKPRAERKIEMKSKDQENTSVPTDSPNCHALKCYPKKEDVACDIMSIVKGTARKPSKRFVNKQPADKSSKEEENTAGLRVKKIMRRAAEDKESSIVVQELRKEIREAVRNKSTKDLGQNLFDPKLLAAFRAAVARPKTETPKRLSSTAVKTKKAILQKGKVRDNLTKKIYGDSNGRRRRAWDRDCEVEFWKYRCMRATKPEKIETLKSVLNLLRKNSEGPEMKTAVDCEASNPILSRLYLADTSVFPRKHDIKPLAVLQVTDNSKEDTEQIISAEVTLNSSHDNNMKVTEISSSKVGDVNGRSPNVTCSKGVTASGKVDSNKLREGHSVSSSSDAKVSSQKEKILKSDDANKDKRKWALEVLARKKALAGNNITHEKPEDNAVLKGNYPLLAQLPVDMRPVLAPSHHKKIPVSVRQTQLYRLTEHFLRKANLPVICRTAVTELAVADAVNIEKQVADRSNSKLVYLNLCSQEISHHSDNGRTSATELDSSPPSEVSSDRLEQTADESSTDPTVVEALRTAGLLSDSPPNSPCQKVEVSDVDDSFCSARVEGPDNIFEMDSHPDVDIYGDFEYDLEDEDYIGSTAKLNKLPEESGSKMKVVFSTLNSERSSEIIGTLGSVEVPSDSPCLQPGHADTEIRSSTVDGGTDKSCVSFQSKAVEEGEELSLAECEELYGPDKEPLVNKFPEGESSQLYCLVNAAVHAGKRVPENNDNDIPNQLVKVSKLGSESAAANVTVATNCHNTVGEENLSDEIQTSENTRRKEKKLSVDTNKQSVVINSISKKVEAYIKEHLRPLCKSGVITAEQYRWAVAKTTDKVMKYHSNAKNANFLIKEGEKVKKLAEQYVETAQQKSDLV